MTVLSPSFVLPCLPLAGPVLLLAGLVLPLAELGAQVPGALLTFSEPEYTQSLGGGPLQVLQPNEIAFLPWPNPCNNGNLTEKWSPRTCLQVMAGDEDNNGQYWNPALFGRIDALAGLWTHFGPAPVNPRDVYWSPSAAMGNHISTSPLRPGDVGRILPGGQIELLISQEQINKSLGLPPSNGIDVDAIAYEPGLGIYFSVDNNLFLASPGCSPNTLVADGDLLAIPDAAITWSLGYTVLDVAPNSAYIVKYESEFGTMLANSQISNRHGAAITAAIDLESLDIYSGPGSSITVVNPCGNVMVAVPDFLFSTESMTGGSIASTVAGGQPATSICGPAAYQLPAPQNGYAVGIQGAPQLGPPSYVNALLVRPALRFVLEPVDHQQNYGLLGGPPTTVHMGAQFNFVFTWVDIVPATVPFSLPAGPFSINGFPDWYCLSLTLWNFASPVNGFTSFTTVPIPVGFSGKLLFQSLGFDTAGNDFEVSTPCVIDVN